MFLCSPIRAYGEKNEQALLENFSYDVLLPERQSNKELGYYDFQLDAGEQQTVQIRLYNQGDDPLDVLLTYNSAKTNGYGVIEYGVSQLDVDPSLKVDFSQIVNAPKKVTIAPKSQEMVDIEITMPEEPFEGYMAGGIQIRPMIDETNDQNNGGNNTMITNHFAFLVGVLICESSPDTIKEKLELNGVNLSLQEGRFLFLTDISNTTGRFVEEMATTITIKEKEGGKKVADIHQENMRMAPNTKIKIPVTSQNRKLKKGDYVASIEVETQDSKKITWVREFYVSQLDANFFNQQIKEEDRQSFLWIKIVVGISIFFVITLAGIYYRYVRVGKKRKKKRPFKSAT